MPLAVHGVVMLVGKEIGGKMSMRTTVLCFFFNSQFPCNSHHKVKQIHATEYVVAVMAESMSSSYS